MQRLSGKQASFIALVAFVVTLFIALMLPGYPIVLSGLLVVIFMSVFVNNNRPTLIAATVSILLTVASYWYSNTYFAQHLFVIILEFLAAVLVLYLKRLYRDFSFEKSHMTALFENATEGILLTDHAGNILLVNPAAEKMFRYEAAELVGKPVELLLPDAIRTRHVKLRDSFYQHPQHRSMGFGRDLYAQKKDGENIPVEVSLSYYYKGNQQYVIAFIVDITRRKEIERNMQLQQQDLERITKEVTSLNMELELKVEERTLILKEALQKLERSQQELNEALDKERQLNEIKSRFVSMASHEFRTPLSSVLSSASLLGKYVNTEDQEKRDRHIDRIKGAVRHLNEILEDFLSLGKLDEGKVNAAPGDFVIDEFIEETNEDMKGLLKEEQSIEYTHEGPSQVYADKKLLKNIMLNLLSNAIKFSDSGSVIKIRSAVVGENLTISIKDEGVGISAEDQTHLFSSFFRAANVVNIQGTGLGLHIVKRYLDLMHGNITVESKIDEGTSFTLNIPIIKK